VGVPTPAFDGAGGGHRTRVAGPGGDGSHAGAQPDNVHGGGGDGGGAVPQLTVEVPTPAFDGTGGGHRARVVGPGGDGGHAGAQPDHVHGGGGAGGGAVPQLTFDVAAPAFDGTGGGHRTRVFVPGGDGGHTRAQPDDVHGGGGVGSGAVPQPTIGVAAPAFDGTGGGHRTGVAGPGGDATGPDRARTPDNKGEGGGGGGSGRVVDCDGEADRPGGGWGP